jgi:ABC-2 type transport system permease protein
MSQLETLQNGGGLLRYKFLKYFEIAKVNYFNSSAYLLNLLSRSAIVIIRIWIFTQLYKVSYSISGVSEIGGLTVVMVVWSLMMTQSFQTATTPRLSRIIDEEVKTGTLAYSVNRPYSYILFHFFGFIGRSIPNLFINLLIGSVAALILVGPIVLSWQALGLGAVLLFFGYVLDFFVSLIIGLTAFWIEDTSAFTWIYSKGQLVFGGLVLPIALFPEYLQKIAELLPFSQMYYAAARLIVHFEPGLFVQYLLTQMAWIVFFGGVAYYLFHKGIKHVSVNGG